MNIFSLSWLQRSTWRLYYVSSLRFLLLTIQFSLLFPTSSSLPLTSYLCFFFLSLFHHLLFYSSFPSSSVTLLLHIFCVVVFIVNFLRRTAGPPVFNPIKLRLVKNINNSDICRFLSYVVISFLFLDHMSYIECLKSCSSQCGPLWTVMTWEDLWLMTWSLTLWQLRCVNKNKKEVNEWTNLPKLESHLVTIRLLDINLWLVTKLRRTMFQCVLYVRCMPLGKI